MGESFTPGDYLANRGTPYVDHHGDLCPGNVGGQIVPYVFSGTFAATNAGLYLKHGPNASTLTGPVTFKGGSIIGLGMRLSAALTASDKGTVKAMVYKGTTDTGVSATIPLLGQTKSTIVVKDSAAAAQFAASQHLRCKLVVSSTIASAALTCAVCVYTEQ